MHPQFQSRASRDPTVHNHRASNTFSPAALILFLAGCLAGGLLLAPSPTYAQKTAEEAEAMPDFDAYAAFRKPQPEHAILAPLAGSWRCAMTVWLHGDPPPEAKLDATLDAEWAFGERFLRIEAHRKGTSHHFETMPLDIHGVYYFGYDTYAKAYYNVLLSEEDVIPIRSAGTWQADARQLRFLTEENDPVTGDSFRKWEIFTLPEKGSGKAAEAPDQLGYELRYGFADGSEIKAGECTFRRVR